MVQQQCAARQRVWGSAELRVRGSLLRGVLFRSALPCQRRAARDERRKFDVCMCACLSRNCLSLQHVA
jgi:hypothetical protein